MYQVCRHIKPSGDRCKSPAMREHSFCYFHARVHSRTRFIDPHELEFPVPEDFAAIQESIAKVLEGIVNRRIDSQQSSQLLRGLQLALRTIPRNSAPPTDSVQEVTLAKNGCELAPPLEICPPALEAASSQKALPSRTDILPALASDSFRRLENVRAEILPGTQQGQVLIGEEKFLRCLDKPNGAS